jgi:hypothetical protein
MCSLNYHVADPDRVPRARASKTAPDYRLTEWVRQKQQPFLYATRAKQHATMGMVLHLPFVHGPLIGDCAQKLLDVPKKSAAEKT